MKVLAPVVAAAAMLVLAACATTPAVAPPAPSPVTVDRTPAKRSALVARVVERAEAATSEGRWSEALWLWRVAEALGSGGRAAAAVRTIEARRRDEAAAAFAEGERYRKARRPESARAAYEAALQSQPTHKDALAALHALDRAALLTAIIRSGGGGPAATRH